VPTIAPPNPGAPDSSSRNLQQTGHDVTGIDNSPGAIEVCRSRGLKNMLMRPIANVAEFESNSFDTILMLGNNFGLFGDAINAKKIYWSGRAKLCWNNW
jgi:hypothetical protein